MLNSLINCQTQAEKICTMQMPYLSEDDTAILNSEVGPKLFNGVYSYGNLFGITVITQHSFFNSQMWLVVSFLSFLRCFCRPPGQPRWLPPSSHEKITCEWGCYSFPVYYPSIHPHKEISAFKTIATIALDKPILLVAEKILPPVLIQCSPPLFPFISLCLVSYGIVDNIYLCLNL